MRILSIDPSYSNFAIIVYDMEFKRELYSRNIKFSPLSSLRKHEREMFLDIDYKSLNDKQIAYYKEIWTNIKLNYYVQEIKRLHEEYKYDIVVTESQFVQSMSDVFASVRLASVINNHALPFFSYKSKSWNKILFNDGGMKSEKAKEVTKLKMQKIGFDFGNCQDLYDAAGILFAFIKNEHNETFPQQFWNNLKVK